MSFIKKQTIHQRKVGDKSFILTADGNLEINLADGKEVRIDANVITTGDTTGPKVANTFYVSTDGSDLNDGRSQDKNGAFASIKKAAEVAPEGSTIIVAPGDYVENNPITLRDFVTVSGQGELRNTRVFPKNNQQTIFYVGNGCYLYQITFRGLRAPGWCAEIRPGTLCTTSPYIQNCTNMNGPWLNDGTEFIPFETVQIEGIEPGARPLLLEDYPDLPLDKQINDNGGGGGMFVDGDAYDPASLVFSFVADAFTQIAQGGIGFHVTNFGYTQIVSCFSVFCSTGFLTTKGGYLSISNSVSDFGTFGVVADGFYPTAYTNAKTDQNYYSTVGSITVNNPGVGYTSAPTVTIEAPTGPGGVTATGTAQVDLTTGQIAAVSVNDSGSGYEQIPQVTFSGGGAVIQAEGTVNLTTNSTIALSSLRDKPQTGSIIQFQGDNNYYYITSTEITDPPFVYDEQVCRRDVRRIVDAVTSDIVFGTTYQSTAAATSYLRSTASKVILDQLAPTIYALESARDQMKLRTSNLAMQEEIDQRFNIITTTLSAGDSSATPDLGSDFAASLNDLSSIDADLIKVKDNVLQNRDFIIEELSSYINDQFTELSYNQTQYETDMTNLLNGLAYYAALGSDQQVIRQAQQIEIRDRHKNMMIASFNYLRSQVLGLSDVSSDATALATVTEGWNQFINIVDDGDSAGITVEFPEHTGVESQRADAKDQLIANKAFIAAEFRAFIADDNPTWSFDTVAFEQDMEYIVDALTFDVLYGGNSSTIQEVSYYLHNNNISSFTSSQKQTLLDAFARIRSVVQQVATGVIVIKTTGNGESQDFSSGTATSTQAAILDSLVQNFETAIDEISTASLPAKTYPLYDQEPAGLQDAASAILGARTNFVADAQTYLLNNYPDLTYNIEKCKRDVGYIIDAIYYDAQLGANHNTITAGLAYSRANTAYLDAEQKPATILALREAKRLLVAAANRDATFQTAVGDLFDVALDIIELDQLPSEGTVYPEPGPASQELINATNQLLDNTDFLKAEIIAHIADNNFVYDQAKCERDTGYIIDAAYYDAALGTNYNQVTNGLAYARVNAAKVAADQLTETVGAIAFAKAESQTATAGDATAQTRVGAAFDEVLDILQNGVGNADALTFPAPSGATSAEQNAALQLQNNRDFLAAEAVAYIQNNYQNFTYDRTKCERDVGYIMDAVALDIALGTNYNAVTAGLAYQRANSSVVQSSQKIQTLGAFGELKDQLVKLGLSDTAETRSNAAMDEILDIIDNGVVSTDAAADALVFPTPSSLPSAGAVEAKDQLIANKDFIIAEITSWIANNYPALVYDSAKCERDVGYIVDALCHDIIYGGNSATVQVANSYFVGAVSQLGSGEEIATADAYNRLKGIVGDIVIELPVVKTGSYVENQDTSGTPATSAEVDTLTGLVEIIEDVVRAGTTSGLPAVVLPSISWADSGLQQSYSTIKGNKDDVARIISIFIANNYQSFIYDEAKCRRDVAIMIEAAAYDAVLNTNYNAVTAGLAYQRANSAYVLSNQNLQTIVAIEHVRDSIASLDVSSTFSSRTNAAFNEILDIIQNGTVSTDDAADALVFNAPTGVTSDVQNAFNEIRANRAFLIEETIAYIGNNYPALVYNETKCRRDTGYIIDAVSYDILYQGNLASKQAAESYLVGAVSQLGGASEITATVAALNDLSLTIADVIQNIGHGTIEQSPVVEAQDVVGPGSSASEAARAQDLLQIIEDVVSAGSIAGMPADAATDILNESAILQADFATATGETTNIQDSTINLLTETFTRDFTFDSTKCARDTRYIVDALTYDILYGGNSATVAAANAYYVGTTSQVAGQQQETANSLEWVNTLLGDVLLDTAVAATEQLVETQDTTAGAASATEVTTADTLLQVFQDVIVNGTDNLPTVTYPDITGASAGIQAAVAALASAKQTIINDTITYIQTTYDGFSYDEAKCSRDTEYLINAVAFDLLYEGNIATLIATRAYFLGTSKYLPDSQISVTIDAYEHIRDVATSCIEGISVTPTTGNTETQVLSGNYGTSTESALAETLWNIPIDALSNVPPSLVGTPSEVAPNTSWLPATIRTAASTMLAQKANIQDGVIDYITTNIIGFEYNIDKCKRDTGYIIDAAIYDLMYGGDKQTRRAASAYYSGAILGAAKVGNTDQVGVTAYSYYYLADLVKNVGLNEPIAKSYNNLATQNLSIPDGDPIAASRLELLIDRLGKAVLDENITGWQERNHDHTLGSSIYNTERETILADLTDIENTTIDDLNATYGGSANIRVFPGIVSVETTQQANLYNVSTISTSGHAFEYVGAGITYNALPFFGGSAIPENEIVETSQGKVFAGGTVDQIGNFRVGNFFGVNALTGSITLNANEIDLQGLTSVGPFIRDGIPVGVELKEVSDNANLIASIGTQDFNTAPTQKAVATYVENRYLNKLTGGTVTGDLILDGNFDVNGDVISTDSTGTFNLLNTTATTIEAFGDATAINMGADNGLFTIRPDLLVEGSLTVNGDIVFTGDVSLNIPDESLQAYSISTEGSLDYISINTRTDEEQITFGIRPTFLVENTTESTATNNGAVVIDGGVGIAKSIVVGGDLTVDGSIILGDDRAVDTIDINGSTDIDIPDNDTSVFRVHENITDYIVVDTTDGSEVVEIGSVPNLVLLNSDDATDNLTGALQATGGISTQRNVHAGVDITADRDIIAQRDLEVNGTNIITDETGTFNLLDTNATTINAFGAATFIDIGASTGTFTIRNEQVIIDSVETLQIPVGTTDDRPTAVTGQIRFNTDTQVFEGYDGIAWGSLGGVKDVDQNTFIRPETSPGANNDELEFFTNGSRRLLISNTDFIVEATNPVQILNTTESVNYTTGALTVAGGVGIAKNLSVQGYITGNNSGVLQLTDLATDVVDIRANTILAQDGVKLLTNAPDSAADDIVYPLTLAHHSISGTPVAGSGTGIKFELETANDNFETGGQIDVVAQDVTGLQEDFDMVFSTMIGGSIVEKLRLGETTTTITNNLQVDQSLFVTGILDAAGFRGSIFADDSTEIVDSINNRLTVVDAAIGTLTLTTDLEVQYGGTGVSTFTTDGILYGNAADPVQVTDAAGTSDTSESFQLLTVVGGGDNTPVWTDTIDGGSF
jgi:hypothetical protein